MIQWEQLDIEELLMLKEMYLVEGEKPVYEWLLERGLVREVKCINCHLSAELNAVITYANRKEAESENRVF